MKTRGAIVVIHRYAGLYMALFLTVAGEGAPSPSVAAKY